MRRARGAPSPGDRHRNRCAFGANFGSWAPLAPVRFDRLLAQRLFG